MRKLKLELPVTILITALLSACGGQAYREGQTNVGNSSGGSTGGGSSGGGSTGTPSTVEDAIPAESHSFSIVGLRSYSGATPRTGASYTVNAPATDNLLKIRINAGNAGPNTVEGVGTTGTYECIKYRVTVNGISKTTKLISTSGRCPGGYKSDTLDFSSLATPGHGSFTVTVDDVATDFQYLDCSNSYNTNPSYARLTYPTGCQGFYPTTGLYKNHTATGTLDIIVNGAGN